MKESKKINRKFMSLFWNILSIFPLFMYLVYLFGFFIVNKGLGVSNFLEVIFNTSLASFNSKFYSFVPSFIYNVLDGIFTYFSLTGVITNFIEIIFGWLITITLLHLFIDVILFLPRFCHNFLERWCD